MLHSLPFLAAQSWCPGRPRFVHCTRRRRPRSASPYSQWTRSDPKPAGNPLKAGLYPGRRNDHRWEQAAWWKNRGIKSLKALVCFVMLPFVFPGRQGKKLVLKGGSGEEWGEGRIRVTDRRGGGGNEMNTSASQASDWDCGRHVQAWEENSGWRAISAARIRCAISKVKNGYFKRVLGGCWELRLLLGFISNLSARCMQEGANCW